jgi:hypothetical protein
MPHAIRTSPPFSPLFVKPDPKPDPLSLPYLPPSHQGSALLSPGQHLVRQVRVVPIVHVAPNGISIAGWPRRSVCYRRCPWLGAQRRIAVQHLQHAARSPARGIQPLRRLPTRPTWLTRIIRVRSWDLAEAAVVLLVERFGDVCW